MDPAAHLRLLGIRPRKDLGQHWLVEAGSLDKIFDAADLSKEDTVVEVGPGPGVLTPGLCERAGKVIAIELDERMLPVLREATAGASNLEIHRADILETDPASFSQPYKVVANVPYYITSAIIKRFLESANRPASMTLTVQAEVAERIVAKPPKMSVLAVSVQLYGAPTIAGRISRTAFSPPPEVDSAVLHIADIGKNLPQTLGGLSEADFFRVVKAGFAEKRKQIHNSLARNLAIPGEKVTELLAAAGIEPSRRAETLTVPEWVKLARIIRK